MSTDKLTLFVLWLMLLNYVKADPVCDAQADPVKAPYCCSRQIQKETRTSTMINGTCSYDYKMSSETPNCPKKPDELGDCQSTLNGKFHCLAEDITYKSVINEKCECELTPVKRNRICCCRAKEKTEQCDIVKGVKETVTVSYVLVKDACKKIESSNTTKIEFKEEQRTKYGKCNEMGIQTNIITSTYMDGCDIKDKDKTETRICSCESGDKTDEVCVGHSTLETRVYKRVLSCCTCNCECRDKLYSFKSKNIICPESTIKKSKCTFPGNARSVTKTVYEATKCKCNAKESVTYEKCPECQYQQYSVVRGDCCECRRVQPVRTTYKSPICPDKVVETEEPCGCNETVVHEKTICDDRLSYDVSYKFKWDDSTKLCIKERTELLNKITCPKDITTTGKCGKVRKYYKKQTTVQYKRDKKTCICQPKHVDEFIICECPPPIITDWICKNDRQLSRSNTTYSISLPNNNCFTTIKTEVKNVVCINTKPDKKINQSKCKYDLLKYFSHVKNCKCVETKTITPLFSSCCMKSQSTTKCVGGKSSVTTVTTYKLRSDHTACDPLVSVNNRIIGCKWYIKESPPRCIGNRLFIIKRYREVQNCRCVKLKVEKKPIKIECPTGTPEVKTRCQDNKWVITTTKWSIENCQCISRSKCVQKCIDCPASVYKRSRCNRKTGKVTVHHTFYENENCKCVRKYSKFPIECPCLRQDRIERTLCVGGKRIVMKMRYDQVGALCQWKVIKSEREDCECFKPISVTTCLKNYLVRTTIKSCYLVLMNLKLPVQRRVQKTVSRTAATVCKNSYRYNTECKNFQQSVVSCTFRSKNCRCVESCRTKCIRACNCQQRNQCSTKCIDNQKYRICRRYSDNGSGCGCGCQPIVSQCAESISTQQLPSECAQPRKAPCCSGCTIYKDNGYYKMCQRRFMEKENCQCKLKTKSWEKLCYCRGCTQQSSCRGNSIVYITTKYYKRRNKCVSRDSRYEKKIDCPKPYLSTKNKACSTQFKVVYYTIENCKCKKRIIKKSNSKCCIKTSIEKQCSGKHWTFTEHRWIQRYTSTKLFGLLSDSPMATFCEHIKRSWKKQIKCARDSFVKICNPQTERLTVKRTYYRIKDCACVKKVRTIVKKCRKCPPKTEQRSACGERKIDGYRYLNLTATTFMVNEGNRCKKIVKHSKEICDCPLPFEEKECRNGKAVTKTTTWKLQTFPPCKHFVSIKEISICCYNSGKPNRWILIKTELCRRPGEYTIATYERQQFNNCTCTRISKRVKTRICCRPCRTIIKCVDNFRVKETICEQPEGLKCLITRTYVKNKIDCPASSRIYIGPRKKCFRPSTVTSYVNENCICVRKVMTQPWRVCCETIEDRQCEGERWKITTTHFELRDQQCIPHNTSDYEDLCTCELGQIEFVDKPIDRCTFWRSYYNKKIVQCKYQRNFIRKEKLNYSCCQPERTVVKCKRNRVVVTTRHYFVLCNFRCHPRASRKEIAIDCSPTELIIRSRTKVNCIVTDTHYKVVYNKCQCERKIVKVESNIEICCCHKKSYNVTKCNPMNGLKSTIYYIYKLKCKKCIPFETKRLSENANCNSKQCRTVIGPCVNNTNFVQLYCMRRVRCRCISKLVHSGNQCCKPESYRWSVVGRCRGYNNNTEFYSVTRYFAFRLTGRGGSCRAVVIRRQRKCCKVREPIVTETCESDIYTRRITVKWTLNEASDSCIRHKSEQLTCTHPCTSKRIRLSRVIRYCNRRTGWGQMITKYKQAKKCRFVPIQTVRRCPCICQVAYPRQERSYCRDNVNIKETKTATCRRCHVRWCPKSIIIPTLNCARIVQEEGNCFPFHQDNAISARYVSTIQYSLINCTCVRKEIKRTLQHCDCIKPYKIERCMYSRIIITEHNIFKKNSICQRSTKSIVSLVPCPSRPQVTRTACRRHNRKYSIITRTFYYANCKCLSRTCQRWCHCKCPAKTVRRQCSRRYSINVITTTWKKVNCRCRKFVNVTSHCPKCPNFKRISIGKCIKYGKVGYQKVTKRRLVKRSDVCRCSVVKDVKKEVCWCNEDRKVNSFCENDNVMMTETWKSVINKQRNVCERVRVSSIAKQIQSTKTLVEHVCNNATGRDVLTVTSFRVVKCETVKTVKKDKGRCRCGLKGIKLLRKDPKCSELTRCLGTNIYVRKIEKNRRCIKVEEPRLELCCCLPNKTEEVSCENNRIKKITTNFNLVNKICIPTTTITEKAVICPTTVIVKRGPCDRDGYKIISKYRNVVKNCQCVMEKFREYKCRCKCCKNTDIYTCNRALGIRTRRVTTYVKRYCKCIARLSLSTSIIRCPQDSRVDSPCTLVIGTDYYQITTITTTHSVNEGCKCVSKSTTTKRICDCKRKERVTRSCDHNRHVITVRKTFVVFRVGRCVKVVDPRKVIVCCGRGKWVLKGDSGCMPNSGYGRRLLTFVRQITVGCSCKEVVRTRQCHCMCRGPSKKRTCRGNRIEQIDYSYKLVKCRCVRSERVRWKTVKCRPLTVIVRKCQKMSNGKYREYKFIRERRIVNCKCRTERRTELTGCKCGPPFSVRKCDSTANVWIDTKYWYKCIELSCRTTSSIPCDTTPDCRVISKCKGRRTKTQLHECTFRRLKNCRCEVETKKIQRPCPCGKTRKERGPCNEITRHRTIKITRFRLIVLRNNQTKCVTRVTHKRELCKCNETTTIRQCQPNNRLIETTVSETFNEKCKTCLKKITANDITPDCFPAVTTVVEKCSATNCRQNVRVISKRLVNCKCQVNTRRYVRECGCCHKNYRVKHCSGAELTTSYHRFEFSNWKCRKTTCHKVKRITCPCLSVRYLTECNVDTLTRIRESIYHTLNKCKCTKSVVRKEVICECRKANTTEKCITSTGATQITYTSFIFNEPRLECIKSEKINLIPLICDTRRYTVCGQPCKVVYKDGRYRKCTTTFGVRTACTCTSRSFSHSKLCYCPKPLKVQRCANNRRRFTEESYYIRVRSRSLCHDFVCVKRTRYGNYNNVLCPRTTIIKGPCVKDVRVYTKKYFVSVNCVCILRSKRIRRICGCPCPKIIRTICVRNVRQETTVRTCKLVCDSRVIPRCKRVYFDQTKLRFIVCRKSQFRVEKCVNGRRKIILTSHKASNCGCTIQTKTMWTHCEECQSDIPLCSRIKAMGLCKKELYRKYLCQFACDYCEDCSKKKCVTKHVGQCKCRKIARMNICSRTTEVTKYIRVNRKCVKHVYKRRSLCGCSMNYTKTECEKLKQQGRCREIKVLRMCEFVCNSNCQLCQGSVRQRKCVQSGRHKATYRVVVVSFTRDCESCMTSTSVTYEGSCKVCSKRVVREVTDCIRGTRLVLTKYVKKERRVCVNKVLPATYSCKNCCRSTETKIGNCANGSRTVVTVFWADINNCCKKQTVTNVYSCNASCSSVSHVRSQCVHNKQIVVKVWRSGQMCWTHRATEMKNCLPTRT